MADTIFTLAADVLECLLGTSAQHALPIAGAGARRDLYAYDVPGVFGDAPDTTSDNEFYLSDDADGYGLQPSLTPPPEPTSVGGEMDGPGPVLGNSLRDCADDFAPAQLAPAPRRRRSIIAVARRWGISLADAEEMCVVFDAQQSR